MNFENAITTRQHTSPSSIVSVSLAMLVARRARRRFACVVLLVVDVWVAVSVELCSDTSLVVVAVSELDTVVDAAFGATVLDSIPAADGVDVSEAANVSAAEAAVVVLDTVVAADVGSGGLRHESANVPYGSSFSGMTATTGVTSISADLLAPTSRTASSSASSGTLSFTMLSTKVFSTSPSSKSSVHPLGAVKSDPLIARCELSMFSPLECAHAKAVMDSMSEATGTNVDQ